MRFHVQLTEIQPKDFIQLNTIGFNSLERGGLPIEPFKPQDARKYVHALSIQGMRFAGYDHYHVQDTIDGARFTFWRDDPGEITPDHFMALVVDVKALSPDPRFGGAYNTSQSFTYYLPDAHPLREGFSRQGNVARRTIKPWSEFVPPSNPMHGIMTDDDHHAQHMDIQRIRGWREYTEGVPDRFIKDGKVVQQRPLGRYNVPSHTRTAYLRDSAASHNFSGVHTGQDHTLHIDTSTASAGNVSDSTDVSLDATYQWVWWDWQPDGSGNNHPNGTYRAQIDCTNNDGNSYSYGVMTINSVAGHFALLRDLIGDEDDTSYIHASTHEQAESAFTGTGLQLATSGTWNPLDYSAAYWEVVLVADHPSEGAHAMGTSVFTLELNESDDFTDGPWGTVFKFVQANAIIGQFVKTVTADAVLTDAGAVTITTTADAVLASQTELTATGDAHLVSRQTLTADGDAHLVSRQTLTADADAHLKLTVALDTDADAVLKSTVELQATADAVMQLQVMLTVDADAHLKATIETTADADAHLVSRQTLDATGDALLVLTSTLTVDADGVLISRVPLTVDSDAVLLLAVQLTTDADGHLVSRQSLTADADGVLLSTIALTTTADAVLSGGISLNTTADAVLLAQLTITTAADALLVVRATIETDADAILLKQTELTAVADGVLAGGIILSATADAVLLAVETLTVDGDAVLVDRTTLIVTADALIVSRNILTLDADAAIVSRAAVTLSADAVLIVATPATGLTLHDDDSFLEMRAEHPSLDETSITLTHDDDSFIMMVDDEESTL